VVARVLEETGLSPAHLELELTESAILDHEDATMGALAELHEMGVGLALDDFGTGYSSLSSLRRFPIERVKIDRSFVGDITDDPDDAALTTAILSMAQSLDLRVVAEGVETLEQAEFLRARGCHELQGFLFSAPVTADEFVRYLVRAKAEGASDPSE
jgi:EAL domain-containing protein (putative c-di-GMP-specific phosphodiesterase class I)